MEGGIFARGEGGSADTTQATLNHSTQAIRSSTTQATISMGGSTPKIMIFAQVAASYASVACKLRYK